MHSIPAPIADFSVEPIDSMVVALPCRKDCARMCTMQYAPVYGVEGTECKIFSNSCVMGVYNCNNCKSKWGLKIDLVINNIMCQYVIKQWLIFYTNVFPLMHDMSVFRIIYQLYDLFKCVAVWHLKFI